MSMLARIELSKLLSPNIRWLENRQTSILSAASVITVATIISAVSGLIVKRLLVSLFFEQSSAQLEAFWYAFQIPDLMYQLIIVGAVSAAFIPSFTSVKKSDLATSFKMASSVLNLLLVLFLVVGAVVFVFADQITHLRTGAEFSEEQLTIVTNLTRLFIVSQFFFAVSNIFTGILQSFHRFVMPALAAIVYNVGILAGAYFFTGSFGIYGPAIGVLIGALLHMLIQMPLVYKLGFRYSFTFSWKIPGVTEFFTLSPPRVLALAAQESRKLMFGFFTTSLGNLSYLMMYLAMNLMVIPIRFFGTSIGQASLPFLSEESGSKSQGKYRDLLLQSLHQIAFLTMPASVLLLILRVPVVRLVFGASTFPWSATVMTSRLVAIVAISITAQSLVQLLVRGFYALKDTRTPLVVALIDIVLYLALCAYFVFYTNWGVIGVATATTITAFAEFLMLILLLNKKIPGLLSKGFWVPQIKMVIASFFMAVFLYLPFRILDELIFDTSRTIELIGLTITTGTIGMLVYIYFAALLEIRELKLLMRLVDSIPIWKKSIAKSPEVLVEATVEDSSV